MNKDIAVDDKAAMVTARARRSQDLDREQGYAAVCH